MVEWSGLVGCGGGFGMWGGPIVRGHGMPYPTGAALWRRLFLHHFDVEGDGYGVADHLVAAGHGVAHENHAEILTIDFGGGGGTAAGPHYLDDFGGAGDVEGYFFSDAVKGEVAGHFRGAFAGAPDFCGLKSDGGIFGYVEEMIAFEIVVAVLHAGVQGVDVDGGVDCGFGDVLVVELDCAGEFCEFSLDVGDAEVANGELGVGVGGVQLPRGGLGGGGGCGEEYCEAECDQGFFQWGLLGDL
jgi:hypothetical protein